MLKTIKKQKYLFRNVNFLAILILRCDRTVLWNLWYQIHVDIRNAGFENAMFCSSVP